jgi:hypothetical protein
MKRLLHAFTRFLDLELDVRARGLVLLAAVSLTSVFFAPLWNLTMFAPQYPDGLRLDIWSYALVGGNGGQDLKEINVLNHYIGMRDLVGEDFTEFHWLPFAVGALALLALRAAVHGRMRALVDVTVLMTYFSAFSLWSFGHRMWQYGHNLAPEAPVKVEGFMPPLFGSQQIANFEVYSYPQAASYGMGLSMLLLMGAVVFGWWSHRRALVEERASVAFSAPAAAAGVQR